MMTWIDIAIKRTEEAIDNWENRIIDQTSTRCPVCAYIKKELDIRHTRPLVTVCKNTHGQKCPANDFCTEFIEIVEPCDITKHYEYEDEEFMDNVVKRLHRHKLRLITERNKDVK